MSENKKNIIFFDGVCNLCNGAVSFIIKRDKKNQFQFASLQSEFAEDFLSNYPELPPDLDSIVYVEEGKIYFKSAAAIRIARKLGGIYKMAAIFKLLPRKLGDRLYDYIARNRYRWFGKRESCMVPDPSLRSRFFD
jgi:predicted DCC family thiol-disulfide oxidoreductase YuxK